jgi:hypothetical protein
MRILKLYAMSGRRRLAEPQSTASRTRAHELRVRAGFCSLQLNP